MKRFTSSLWKVAILGCCLHYCVFHTSAMANTSITSIQKLIQSGKYQKAYSVAFKQKNYALAAEAAFLRGAYGSGSSHQWLGRAVDCAQRALKQRPNNTAALFTLARAKNVQANINGPSLAALGLVKETRSNLDKLLTINPQHAEAKAMLSFWHVTMWNKMHLFGDGNVKLARKLAKEAQDTAPQSIFVHYNLGIVFLEFKEPNNAKKMLKRAVKISPHTFYEKKLQKQAKETLNKIS